MDINFDNGHQDAGSGGIGHQRRSLKVIDQVHLKRYIYLTANCDQVCV